MFPDTATIHVSSGAGGNGCESFERDRAGRIVRKNGGDGGNGGDVILIARPRMHTLLDFRMNRHYKAESGGHGSSYNKKGAAGSDCVIPVPCGTTVRDSDGYLMRDLVNPSDSVVAARGGRGGRGNSGGRQVSRGEPGRKLELQLELKLITDAGIIGCPNAGKSSLLNALTRARSRVAAYPFTTKSPVVGIVDEEDYSYSVADLPGLIEEAHHGRGLGTRFLKHAERTMLLVHVVDMSDASGSAPQDRYAMINRELSEYTGALRGKPQVVVASKMDLAGSRENFKAFRRQVPRAIAVSSLTGEGIEELKKALAKQLGYGC